MTSQMSQRTQRIALLIIALIALGLRFYHLDAQSIWNDEGTSVALAARDLPTITANAASDIHPPFYYYLLHFWMRLFGNSVMAIRGLSVLCGVGIVLASYWLAKPLIGAGAALLGALMLSISPFQIYYAQETRMYALATMCGVLATVAFQRMLGAEEAERKAHYNRMAVAYVMLCVAAIYSHYLSAVFVVAHNVAFLLALLTQKHAKTPWSWRLIRWVGLQVIILVAYVPWLVLSWHSLRNWPAVSEPLRLRTWLPEIARIIPLGITIEVRKRSLLLALLGWAPALVGMWPHRDKNATGLTRTLRNWLLPLCLLTPLLVILGLSLQRPMYKPKFLLLSTPGFLLLQAHGIVRIGRWLGERVRRTWVRAISTGALALLASVGPIYSLANLYWNPTYYRDDYRGIVEYINAAARDKDAILINAPAQIETIDYYYDGQLPEYPLPLQRPIDIDATQAALEAIVGKHERLYCIFWATNESDPDGFIEGWLSAHCFETIDVWYGNIRLVVYAVPQETPSEPTALTDHVWDERIALEGYSLLSTQPESGDIVQITLFWQALEPVEERYKVFIHLVDQHGHIVGQRDSEPVGGTQPTNGWATGQTIADHYGVLVQPGTAPGPVTLRLGLYALSDGQRLTVPGEGGEGQDALDLIELNLFPASSPPPIAILDINRVDDLEWDDIQLLGHSLYRLGHEHEISLELHPGDISKLVCYWQKVGEGGTTNHFIVALERGRETVWEQPAEILGGTYALNAWQPGEIVRDTQLLYLPADLAPGDYKMTLRFANAPRADSQKLQSLRISP